MERVEVKENNLAIKRIEERCINCGMCAKTCLDNNGIEKDCINCGQCILTCPTGALVPKYSYKQVLNYLHDTDFQVMVITSPAVRVAIGDEFGFEAGTFLEGKMVSALKHLGFVKVFDTTFGADLTIIEEAKELITRLEKKENLPMFTSCCPSWVNYAKKYHADNLENISTCKSPIGMIGAMVKTYYAEYNEINPSQIILVALTPCVSKKEEIYHNPDVDFCITTSELAMMIREANLDFKNLTNQEYDSLLGKGSSAGLIFGASGGVTEAVLRTSYYFINNETAPQDFYHLEQVRGEKNFKEAIIDLKKIKIKVAVINKLISVKENYEKLKDYDFVEVMTCPGGCIGGAGQSLVAISKLDEYREKRSKALYEHDDASSLKTSYENEEIIEAYQTFIKKGKVKLHTEHKSDYTTV